MEGEKVFVNLTPHVVNIYTQNKHVISIPPSGIVARVETEERVIGLINDIPVVKTFYGDIVGLPDYPEPNAIYIVSYVVAQAILDSKTLRDRFKGHILVPNTSPSKYGAVRDSKGKIMGVKSLVDPYA